MKTIFWKVIGLILMFQSAKVSYGQQSLDRNNGCNTNILKCDLYDKRIESKEDDLNRFSYLYISSKDCDSMNFIISDSNIAYSFSEENELSNESTYFDTCFYLLYYIKDNYLNKEKIHSSKPVFRKIGKGKTSEFYHCTFKYLNIDWVARLNIFEGKVIHLQVDVDNKEKSKSLIGYFVFTAMKENKW